MCIFFIKRVYTIYYHQVVSTYPHPEILEGEETVDTKLGA
ncbi:hypothetical protein BAOM_0384 [Peribacillus asahii]|uniref:Uncharacterized protein n=1 Tax=Peribacillus asahii TaxID=228899 RepID=A0A3Q9RK07_9BACI|nr:hypothetical protein BAOM_0384 [Peribacillus asahii]